MASRCAARRVAGPIGIAADAATHHAPPRHETPRWATHGPPSQRNAHPHSSPDAAMVVVQNGIVENFQPLRRQLQDLGYVFHSDTDTEGHRASDPQPLPQWQRA
ncbi:MAG: hypothetical protein R2856_35000 [Caldilineaceae bacterium]